MRRRAPAVDAAAEARAAERRELARRLGYLLRASDLDPARYGLPAGPPPFGEELHAALDVLPPAELEGLGRLIADDLTARQYPRARTLAPA